MSTMAVHHKNGCLYEFIQCVVVFHNLYLFIRVHFYAQVIDADIIELYIT
ncbi:MAG: hypothetical protein JWO58_2016 [Chitinophagaceae bacterium]|nr:hypothetical protein [Chitinophagaceae bacterium]